MSTICCLFFILVLVFHLTFYSQIRTLSSKAHILSKKWGNVPVILAGDYNSTPQVWNLKLYEYLSSFSNVCVCNNKFSFVPALDRVQYMSFCHHLRQVYCDLPIKNFSSQAINEYCHMLKSNCIFHALGASLTFRCGFLICSWRSRCMTEKSCLVKEVVIPLKFLASREKQEIRSILWTGDIIISSSSTLEPMNFITMGWNWN